MSIQDELWARLNELDEQIIYWSAKVEELRDTTKQIEHVERVLLELLELKRETAQRLARMERAVK